MKRRWIPALLLTGFFPLGLIGCAALRPAAAPPLPVVEWETLEDARQILIDRQDAIESVQAQFKLKFTSPPPESETQTLDAALVMQGEDRYRLRAWKLNQTIFDLTVTSDGTFVVANEEIKKQAPEAEQDLGELAEQLGAMLRGPDYSVADISRVQPTPRIPPGRQDHGLRAAWGRSTVKIDSRTLTPIRFDLRPDEANRSAVGLETRYTAYPSGIWFAVVRASGDFGEVELTFREVELNGELNPRAFRPSRRAVRLERVSP